MEIGKILKEERLKKGLTLEDVSKETLIRVYYLEQIEQDNFPEEFDGFILSYIKKYADFLGIDPIPLLQGYKELYKEKEEILTRKRRPKKLLYLLVSVFLIGFLIIAVFYASKRPNNLENQIEVPLTPSQTETPSPNQNVPPPITTETPSNNPQLEAPVVLILKSSGRCWLGITIDGKYSQRFINNGESLKLTANNYIQIRFGNAKVVSANLNGKDIGLISPNETVVEMKFTKTGVERLKNP